MEGLGKALVLSKELFTLLQEFVCEMYASKTSLCKVNDLRYQLFRVKNGDVDSRQSSIWKKVCFEQKTDTQARETWMGYSGWTNSN